jgi:DNA invertase Pin-like site-specific DNA recombinase
MIGTPNAVTEEMKMESKTKSIGVYLRVSTEGTKNGHTQTTESQHLDIQNYLKSKGISDFTVYEDVGISGRKKDRPALNRLLKDCKDNKISMVVCYKLDRLFRSLKDLMETVAFFQELGVEFVSVKDSIDMSCASGRLLFQILGSFAEFEAATIRERVISGLANARSKGIKLGPPFKKGHSVVKSLKEEGKTVKEIAEHTGLSRKTVYRALKDQAAV